MSRGEVARGLRASHFPLRVQMLVLARFKKSDFKFF